MYEEIKELLMLKPIIFIVVIAVLSSTILVFLPFGLNPFSRRATVIRSESMQPTFGRGDVIFLKDTDVEEVREGNVVAVNVPGYYQENYGYPPTIVHRVVDVSTIDGEIYLETRGDANSQTDIFRSSRENLVGVYTGGRIGSAGLILLFAGSLTGMLTLVLVFVILIIAIYLPWYVEKKEDLFVDMRKIRETVEGLEDKISEVERDTYAGDEERLNERFEVKENESIVDSFINRKRRR